MSYEQLMIDPPWPRGKGGKRNVRPRQSRTLDYQMLGFSEIFALLDDQIFPQASPMHNAWLWVIDPFLLPAEQMMDSRGYKRHARFIWDKQNGIAPAFTVRFTHEYLIWYYKPKLLPVVKSQRGRYPTVFYERPRQHSRKPDAAYEMIKALYPADNCLDVFSRESRNGWAQWGDDVRHFDEAESCE